LERCGAVYRRLGSPRPARRVVTVAGTNGKGSTVAYLEAMSLAAGQRCGSYTSPHLLRFNERIRLQGEPVPDERLLQAFERVEDARQGVSLTYFEFTTLAAFVIFEQASLDFAVLEVGLGGRLDTVNLVDADCAVITAIGLDHQQYLGPDIDAIAAEKAGVMRPAAPVVCGARPPAPILRHAAEIGAPLYRYGSDYQLLPAGGRDGTCFEFRMGAVSMPARTGMSGQHQLGNLAAALAAFLLLFPEAAGAADALSAALGRCALPGRLQTAGRSPAVLLDVGHNPLAAEAVAVYLASRDAGSTVCVIAMLADKAAEAVAAVLGGVVGHWRCVDSHGERGQRAEVLARRIRATLPGADVRCAGSFGHAIEAAVAAAGADGTVLVFGSFSIVAEASRWLQTRAPR